jgi:hypothetical protein
MGTISDKRVLVVTDVTTAGWVSSAMAESTDTHWSVLVLGHNAAAYRRQNEDTLQHFRYEILQVDELARLAEEDLQSFYPEFMFSFPRNMRMGGLTLLELFRRKDGVNLWWFGETCEKAPLRGPFLDQLFRLALLPSLEAVLRQLLGPLVMQSGCFHPALLRKLLGGSRP